jgi:hypothetical protein
VPEKHFYFSIGALLGTLIAFLVGRVRRVLPKRCSAFEYIQRKERHWFLYFPIIIFIVGLWGLVPDALHALNILPKEVTRGPYFNVFFFHSYFEWIEDTYHFADRMLNWFGELILLAISIGVMLFYVKQVKKALLFKRNATVDSPKPKEEKVLGRRES